MYKTICITNRHLVEGDFLKQIARVLKMEPDALILREKDLSADVYEEAALSVLPLCKEAQVPCYFNSQWKLAEKLGADGAQLSFGDFKKLMKERPMNQLILGVSVHSVEEAVQAQNMGASYIIYGHIFETECKKGSQPRGIPALRKVCQAVAIPVYAIGGICAENAHLCIEAGACGVCMMSAFMEA